MEILKFIIMVCCFRLGIILTHHWGYLAAGLSAIFYSVSYALNKLFLVKVEPLLLAGIVYLASGLYLISLRLLPAKLMRPLYNSLGLKSVKFPSLKIKDLPALFATVFLGSFVAPVSFYYGLALSRASLVSLTAVLEIVFTFLIAYSFFKEKFKVGEAVGIALITLGVAHASLDLDTHGVADSEIRGMLLVIIAYFSWALDNNLSKILALEVDIIEAASWKAILGGVLLISTSLILTGSLRIELEAIAASALVGIISLGNSLLLFFAGLRHIGAGRTASIFATNSVLGVIWSLALLEERLTTHHLISILLVFAGLVALYKSRNVEREAPYSRDI